MPKQKLKPDTKRLPLLTLREVVVFPYMMTPFVVGRERSVRAIEEALAKDKRIYLVTQRDSNVDEPKPADLFRVGTIATIVQSLKVADGNVKVLVEGIERGQTLSVSNKAFFQAVVRTPPNETQFGADVESLTGRVTGLFEEYVKLNQSLNYDTMIATIRVDEPGKLADTIGANLPLTLQEKQELLEVFDPVVRLGRIAEILDIEIEKSKLDRTVQGLVKRQIDKAQKEFYLTEKIRAIRTELNLAEANDLTLKQRIESADMSTEAFDKANAELERLLNLPQVTTEKTASRDYLNVLLSAPWKKRTLETRGPKETEELLDASHYGLSEVKERVLEHLAVRQLVKAPPGPVLCLVGPRGVGKTSYARAIAQAAGRKCVRIGVAGITEASQIRGWHKGQMGARPGQVLQTMIRVGCLNPVMIIDELDGVPSADTHSETSYALLDLLDRERNRTFVDRYLDVEFDLSEVFLVATARTIEGVDPALQECLEVIRFRPYSEPEKFEIGRRFLAPHQIAATGLIEHRVEFTDSGIRELVRRCSSDPGVEEIDRQINYICRKVARRIIVARETNRREGPIRISEEMVREMIGTAQP